MNQTQPFRRAARALRNSLLALTAAATTASAVLIATPATADAATSCLRIVSGKFDAAGTDAQNLNDEYVNVKSVCSVRRSLRGWYIRNSTGGKYTFPSWAAIGAGRTVRVHVGQGPNGNGHFYMRRTTEFWKNTGDKAVLFRPVGTVAWTYVPPSAAWTVPFGSRPRSGAITLKNCSNRTISNLTFRDLPAGTTAIRLFNCSNVTIRAVDFINVPGAIFAMDSSNIRVIDSRYQNITGPSARTGANVGNFVQFYRVNGGLVDHNKGKGGDTEDVVSLVETHRVTVEDNFFEGTNWSSASSTGINLSDVHGSYNVARRNILVNIGAVGIGIGGGRYNRIENNRIYGAPRTNSNVGMYVWNQGGSGCSNHSVTGNRVYFRKANGVHSPWWNGENCGSITMSGNSWSSFTPPHVSL